MHIKNYLSIKNYKKSKHIMIDHNLESWKSESQYMSWVETGSKLVIKGCYRSYGTVYLSLGSFFKQIIINYFA